MSLSGNSCGRTAYRAPHTVLIFERLWRWGASGSEPRQTGIYEHHFRGRAELLAGGGHRLPPRSPGYLQKADPGPADAGLAVWGAAGVVRLPPPGYGHRLGDWTIGLCAVATLIRRGSAL